jgi:hypothetical protein
MASTSLDSQNACGDARELTMRSRWRLSLLTLVGLVVVVGLAVPGQAAATYLTPSDAFYWNLPAVNGNPNDQQGAIATSPDGSLVYVADKYGNYVEEYTSDGTYQRAYRSRTLSAPTGVTTDLSGNVYVVYEAQGVVAKFTAGLKLVSTWSVPFAKSIAADRAGDLWVLTNFLNAVGEFDPNGKSIGGFVANLPGQYDNFAGYDPPDKTVATAIAVDGAGRPIVVGESDQPLSNPEPDCHSVIDEPYPYGVDHHPYPDPLVSGEAVRFTPAGAAVNYGWLSDSDLDCYHGWMSDGYGAGGVAVDPNSGGVYATDETELGVLRLGEDLSNPSSYGGQPPSTEGNLPLPCFSCSTNEEFRIAGNPPLSVAVDCHSNVYVLTNSNARAVVKYVNQDVEPPSSCSPLLQRALIRPGISVFPRFGVNRSGKASVLLGCDVKLCKGTISLGTNSSLCRHCILSVLLRFRINPGLEKTLSVKLNKLGRRLLSQHPGITIKIIGKLRGGRTTTESEQLREPATLTDVCRFPASVDGQASVTGELTPAHGHERITLEYLPPEPAGVFLPAVQRTVFTDRAGRYSDSLPLGTAGKWIVVVSWSGDHTRQATGARPCAGTVQKAQTHLTLVCPSSPSIATPAPFTGSLSGAPSDVTIGVSYEQPSGALIPHDVSIGSGGTFADSFAPSESGAWQAIAHYNGDTDHSAALAVCQFTVTQAASSVSLQCTANANRQSISCTGQLTSDGGGIAQAPIALTYQPPAGSATVDLATTAADGTFSDKLTAPVGSLLASGTWTVKAQYAGDSTHGPASTTQNVIVP